MRSENELKTGEKIKRIPLVGYFWEPSFFHYLWIGALFSAANIFLLWLFIDIFKIPTLASSAIVIGGTFILRYVLFKTTKVI